MATRRAAHPAMDALPRAAPTIYYGGNASVKIIGASGSESNQLLLLTPSGAPGPRPRLSLQPAAAQKVAALWLRRPDALLQGDHYLPFTEREKGCILISCI